MAYALSPPPRFLGFDESGIPLSGGLLYSYAAGTSTPLATYSDTSGTANANPLTLNAAGWGTVYLTTGVLYKFILKDSAGATIWTQDNVSVPSAGDEPSGTEGAVPFYGADTFLTEDPTNLFYNDATNRLRVGPEATLFSFATGNLGFGSAAGDSITTGDRNLCFGTDAGTALTTGNDNVAIGNASLDAGLSVLQNVAIGTDALGAVTTSEANTAIGYQAMSTSTTNGGYNVAIGYRALRSAAAGATENVAIGFEAMGAMAGTGDVNVAIGTWALRNVTTGSGNIGISDNAGSAITTGGLNVCVGESAGTALTTGSTNTAIGQQALASCETASDNTAVGSGALSFATGANGAALGLNAGDTITSGANCTMVGASSDGAATGANQTSLGYQATCTAADQVTLGNASVGTLRCQQTTITALSDARDKRNVENIPLGLAFINSVRPVRFEWNMRDGAKVGVVEGGFIAQQLHMAAQAHNAEWLGLVDFTDPDRLEASPGKLLPVLIRAVQELSERLDALTGTTNEA